MRKRLQILLYRLIRWRFVGKPAVHVVSGIVREGVFSTSREIDLYFVQPASPWRPGVWVDFKRVRWDRTMKAWTFHD